MSPPEDAPVGGTPPDDTLRIVERVARASYGRLVAFLSARSGDVAGAEDALSDALVAALEAWLRTGVPDNPEGWLLSVARRRRIDATRHDRVRADAEPRLRAAAEAAQRRADEAGRPGEAPFSDERLRLLFLCAHPAIEPAARTPLMLQTVLGLDAARIASAFLVTPSAMSQRLVRAKAKIRDAGIPVRLPDPPELAPRLEAVLEAIYAAYGSGWDDVAGADPRRKGLAEEALWLGRTAAGLMPTEPEAAGLLALMLHCEARRAARRDAEGRYVPLDRQDPARWSRGMIAEAEAALASAARLGRPGRFQLEAAIQSAHARRAFGGGTDWEAVALLYEGLVRLAPTVGAMVGRAAALAEARGPDAGLAALDALRGALGPAADDYQPAWALRGHLLRRLGREDDARAALSRAAGLSEDPAVRAFLLG